LDTIVVAVTATSLLSTTLSHIRSTAGLSADDWVIQNGSGTALPIINQTLANLPNGLLDTLGSALNFNNALRGLWEHLLLSYHANT
jgi:hypothetical protein